MAAVVRRERAPAWASHPTFAPGIPTDLTDRTIPALELTRRLRADGTRVTLLHVIETIHGADDGELDGFYRRLEAKARSRMAELARMADGGAPAGQAIVYGRRAAEIVRFASAESVDLIVIPSHRIDWTSERPDLGNISYTVGMLAACPVLLAK